MTHPTDVAVIADTIVTVLGPRTTYDAGCGDGSLVRSLAERGIDARGGDPSEFVIAEAAAQGADRLEVRDLTQPFDGRYDLVTCIDVLEEMAPQRARAAIANLCAATDRILLSSTPDDFGEPTHVNVRPPAAWAQDFATQGFFRRTDIDASFVSPWAVLLERGDPTPVEVVVRYEAMLAPILREVLVKRQAVLELQREIDEIGDERTTATRDRMLADERCKRLAIADELIGVRAELAENRVTVEHLTVQAGEEAVRLRAVIAGLETEVAQARRQASQAETALLEQQSRAERAEQAVLTRSDELAAEYRSAATWRIGRAVTAPARTARRWLRRGR